MISFCGTTSCQPGSLCALCTRAWERMDNLLQRIDGTYRAAIVRALSEIPWQNPDGSLVKGLTRREGESFWNTYKDAYKDEAQKMMIQFIQDAQTEQAKEAQARAAALAVQANEAQAEAEVLIQKAQANAPPPKEKPKRTPRKKLANVENSVEAAASSEPAASPALTAPSPVSSVSSVLSTATDASQEALVNGSANIATPSSGGAP